MYLRSEASETAVRILKAITRVHQERKIFTLALRELAALFRCDSGSVFTYLRAKDEINKITSLTSGETWEAETVMRFFRNEKPLLTSETIMAPVRSGPSIIGVMALGRKAGFEQGAGRVATEVLRMVGSVLEGRRNLAVSAAGSAIGQAALAGVSPKNVLYRLLHQLRRFIDYSHGASVILRVDDRTGLVVGRQIAWTEGRSTLVGMRLPVIWHDVGAGLLDIGASSGDDMIWKSLAALREEGSPPKRSMLIAPVESATGVIGLIDLASRQADFFLDTDKHVLSRFLPYVSWCLTCIRTQPGGPNE